MKQKAGDVVTATKLDQPLKQLDAAAAKGLGKMEETTTQVNQTKLCFLTTYNITKLYFLQLKYQWDAGNKNIQAKAKSVTTAVRERSDKV